MKYMGSKARIAKYILPIILKDRKEGQFYVEPFCGGCNSLDKVGGPRIGADVNPYLVAMWKFLQGGREFPLDIPKPLYDDARRSFNRKSMSDPSLIGWIGYMASFNGRFFDGGYSGTAKGRDYIREQTNNTLKQTDKCGAASDAESLRCKQGRPTDNGDVRNTEIGDEVHVDAERFGGEQIAVDTQSVGLSIPGQARNGRRGFKNCDVIPSWCNFPTQPPVRSRDDGIRSGLDGITFPAWRRESIKAYGNAIVPQVFYQIAETINRYERL